MIRFIDNDATVTPEDIIGRYVWLRPSGKVERWTAFEYPVLITAARHERYPRVQDGELKVIGFKGYQERPVWSEEEQRHVIRGGKQEFEPHELKDFDDYHYLNRVKCICDTAEEVNAVRALGERIRRDQDLFWAQAMTSFNALAEFGPEEPEAGLPRP